MAPITQQRTIDPPSGTSESDGMLGSFLTAVALLLIATIGGLVIIEGFGLLQPALGLGESFALTFVIGGSLATFWFALVGIVYLRYRPVTIHYDLRWPTIRDGGWILGGLAAIVLASLIVELVVSLIGSGSATNISTAAAVENPMVIYSVFIVANLVFIAPIEEFLFRGVIQGRLRESFGAITAISITSIGFALTHIPSYWFGGSDLLSIGVFGALLSITVGGLGLGYVYERTNSLLIVSIIHGLINTIGIGIALIMFL